MIKVMDDCAQPKTVQISYSHFFCYIDKYTVDILIEFIIKFIVIFFCDKGAFGYMKVGGIVFNGAID